MINSLFESFDPITSLLSLNFIVLLTPITTPSLYLLFTLNNRILIIIKTIFNFIYSELAASLNNKNKKTNILFLWSVFFRILLFNLRGLLPYIYTITRQIIFTLSLALPFWRGFILFCFAHNINHFLRHLVPLSTPLPLSQFITIIETIRQIIRPITLSVRLCANITAGHILIALASKPVFIFHYFSLIVTILIVLERAVAFIQRYVFTILLSIYLRETY
jgi:ATP synthase subunit 6